MNIEHVSGQGFMYTYSDGQPDAKKSPVPSIAGEGGNHGPHATERKFLWTHIAPVDNLKRLSKIVFEKLMLLWVRYTREDIFNETSNGRVAN